MLTKRTAPLSSTTSGVVKRKILIAGENEEVNGGGATCVTMITSELDMARDDRKDSRLLSDGAETC